MPRVQRIRLKAEPARTVLPAAMAAASGSGTLGAAAAALSAIALAAALPAAAALASWETMNSALHFDIVWSSWGRGEIIASAPIRRNPLIPPHLTKSRTNLFNVLGEIAFRRR